MMKKPMLMFIFLLISSPLTRVEAIKAKTANRRPVPQQVQSTQIQAPQQPGSMAEAIEAEREHRRQATQLHIKEEIIFSGIPEIKVSEGGLSRVLGKLNGEKALSFKCTITKIDDKYYWTTRENLELVPVESRGYITFLAINGSGYVRILKPEMKDIVNLMAMAGDPEEKYDYVEHLLLGLKSVTYYGTSN